MIGVPLLALVAILGWRAASWLGLAGPWVWIVRSVLWILGALLVHLVVKLFKGSGAPARRAAPDPMDALLEQARKRLNAAGVRGRHVLGKLPVLLVMGPRGSAKSTFVQQSRLDAEHLAGSLYSGDLIAPTELLNMWYHDDLILLEAGGPLAVDPGRWAGLVQRIQPRKWIPALLGRPQAPRVAIVCFSMEDLLESSEGAVAAARNLRDRLAELSEAIGIRLPVYVVFTKADALPHFAAFVENLTEDETHELLGTTLRALGEAPAGMYAEREAGRLATALEELFQTLAERRPDVMSRTGSNRGNGAAYEFPREFRKMAAAAVPFLVELCRPSQLRVSPFLRGFYFAGVRPVVVESEASVRQTVHAPEPVSTAGATQVFDLRQMQERAARAEAAGGGRARRVPQWVFMDGILRRVILRDRVAMGITTSGFGLSVLRRASLAAAIGALILLGGAIIVSHQRDRALQEQVASALTATADLRAPVVAAPPEEDLERLDELRVATERLSRYENERRPLRSAIFMYTGDELYPLARRAYFDRFRTVLLSRGYEAVQESLRGLPQEPTLAQYEQAYRSLKAYVEMTDHPEHATAPFFGDVLTERWTGVEPVDSARLELARRQFAFYGAELPYGDPYGEAANAGMVNTTRSFLAANTNEDSFYGSLVAQWNRLPAARLDRDRPETRGFLRNSPEIPGAFTLAGWDSVHASLDGAAQAASLDLHVVGTEFFDSLRMRGFEPEVVAPRLRARYESEYRDAWVRVLRETQLEPRGLQGGRDWLTDLGGSRSAFFQLLTWVDSQTSVPSPEVTAAFGALQGLTAPDSVRQLYSEGAGSEYLMRVQSLAQAIGRLADAPGDQAVADEVRRASTDGLAFVQNTGLSFPGEPESARLASRAVTDLLTSPFRWGDGQVGQGPQLAANQLAAEFCGRQQERVLGRYPFQPGAAEAAAEDVAALFDPAAGELGAFLQAAEGSGATLNDAYESFRTGARAISNALYALPGGTLGFDFTFQVRSFEGIDRVELRVDGNVRAYTLAQQDRERFVWDASRAELVTLLVHSGERRESLEFSGPWAIFRLFHQGTWQSAGGSSYRVTWTLDSGARVTADVGIRGVPVLDRSYLSGFTCPRRIAR
jgi:type VI secretion system protein ImpL